MPHLLQELIPFFTGLAIVLFLAYSVKVPPKTAPPLSSGEPLVRDEAAEKEMRELILHDMVVEAVELYQKTYHVDISTAGLAITAIARTVLPPGTVDE